MANHGKKSWYIVDGWLPSQQEMQNSFYEGHEAVMILNCHPVDAEVTMDIYYEDRDPIEGILIHVPAKRVKCLRMDHPEEIGGIVLHKHEQYSLKITSSVEVIVQYGRMDVTQPNLAYIGMMGYSE